MPRIYCGVLSCSWIRERHVISNNKSKYKYCCSKNNIHLSAKGLCLDFKGKETKTPFF